LIRGVAESNYSPAVLNFSTAQQIKLSTKQKGSEPKVMLDKLPLALAGG
jgi:hypothetical protein